MEVCVLKTLSFKRNNVKTAKLIKNNKYHRENLYKELLEYSRTFLGPVEKSRKVRE